jgi:RNA polymerase sigma-70 factor, ECF subfamily
VRRRDSVTPYSKLFFIVELFHHRMNDRTAQAEEDDMALARRIACAAPSERPSAEAELCRRLGPRIRLYGLRHLRDGHAAADLVQHVLLLTIESLRSGKLREPERLVSYVFGACRVAVLELRRGQARRERILEAYAREAAELYSAPEPRMDHERVARCLGGLPERERSVLLMSFYDDRGAEDVGRELGLRAGNVRVIRHRGLRRLRDCVMGRENLGRVGAELLQ